MAPRHQVRRPRRALRTAARSARAAPEPTAKFVLDTSAVLALRGNEPGSDRVETILRDGDAGRAVVLLSFMTRMELLYRVTVDEGEEAAMNAVRLLDATKCRWVSCTPEILSRAAHFRARGGISIADAWIAATADIEKGTLVHKDREFARVAEVRQETLPR